MYQDRVKTCLGKKKKMSLWKERNQWNLQETGHSEISKGRSFMGVLKYLIPSVEGNKMKLLWVLPIRKKLAFPCGWNIRKKMVQVLSKPLSRLVYGSIFKEYDL